MKLLPLLAVFCQIAWTLGSPIAEADADADAQYNGYPYANTKPYNPNVRRIQSAQMGGPGYGQSVASSYLDPAAANNMEGYGSLGDMPESGNVAPEPYQQYPTYVPGQASNYARGPQQQPQFNEPAPDMTGYGSVNDMPEAGNVQAVPEGFNNFMSPPIYNSPPMQNYPSMPMNKFNNNPISSGPDATRPSYKRYVPLQAQYAPPVNSQGRIFTRSYTPIQGTNGNCMNVCRTRPMFNARPLCRSSCNVRPLCGQWRSQVDYVRQGQTTFCNAKRLRRPMPIPRPLPQPIYTGGCTSSTCEGSGYNTGGNGGSGYNNGGNGGSGYNNGNGGSVYYPDNGGSGYNNGGCIGSSCGGSGYNNGGCIGSSCGGSGYNNGGNGGSVYYPDNGGSGYNNGGCSGSTCGGSGYNSENGGSGYNNGGCSGPTCGGSGYNSENGGSGYNTGYDTGCTSGTCGSSLPSYEQAETLPAQLGGWGDEQSFDESSGMASDAGAEEEVSSDPAT